MKKAMVLMILGASFSCYALDFDKLIESAKTEVNSLLGKEEKKVILSTKSQIFRGNS